MPSYDPNSFSDGISHLEWDMLSQDDHVPLRNKTLQGLYPPGSTVKPMAALSFLHAGLSPTDTVNCAGSLRVGNTQFHCWRRGGHGAVDMHRGIEQSCDIYFYVMAQRMGMQVIADMARNLGLGQKFPLPFPSQSYGTVPDPAWKLKKYKQEWQIYDTVNATIGQGYMLVNPTQLAVMAARLASGKMLMPSLLADRHRRAPASLGVSQEHLDIIHNAMKDVINGGGTGRAARLPVPNVLMAGKTGTAQVRRITMAERGGGVRSNASLPFKLRDHALFQGFAPYDKPRYAIGTILEHGGHVSHIEDSTTISGDVMTYLFDPAKAMQNLETYEKQWGGDPATRMKAKMDAWRIAQGLAAAPPPPDADNASNAMNATESSAAAPPAAAAPTAATNAVQGVPE
jgi:penicillin-binding protein 2